MLRRVYHFLNRCYGLDDLQRQRLKIATINDLNDPFEMLGPAPNNAPERARFRILKNQLAASYGMLCFSRNWQNPVQWSHYADGHKGLCLGFDVPANTLTSVRYRRTRLPNRAASIDGENETVAQSEMLRVLSSKYVHWQYEEEERCFLKLEQKDSSTGLYFASWLPNLLLKEVLIGHNCTVSRAELDGALGNMKAEVRASKVRLSFKRYAVVRQRDAARWS